MKKKKGIKVLVGIIVIAFLLTCTPGMALRTSAFFFDIGSAFTLEYEKKEDVSKHKTIYRITENVPVEKATQGELRTWMVYHFGPFNFAKYYGEA